MKRKSPFLIGLIGLAVAASSLGGSAAAATEPPANCALDARFGVPAPGTPAGTTRVAMSAELDEFRAIAVGRNGKVYGSGVARIGGDAHMAVARLNRDGTLDPTFSGDGIQTINVQAGGTGELAQGLAVQSTGKVIFGGPVDLPGGGLDRDIAVGRLNVDGTLDATFGDGGIKRLDLSTGAATPTGPFDDFSFDFLWGITVLPGDKLFLNAVKRDGVGADVHRDFEFLRLTANGQLDPGFGTAGKLTVDVGGYAFPRQNVVQAFPRQNVVQSNGKILASGYVDTVGASPTEPLTFGTVIRINPDGTLDNSFNGTGIAKVNLMNQLTEFYDIALQGSDILVTGYGQTPNDPKGIDLIASRLKSNGSVDASFGIAGLVRLDVAGFDDRGRDMVVLPDQRIMIAGEGRRTATQQDGMVAMFSRDGAPESDFGPGGYCLIDLGGPSDSFRGISLLPDARHAYIAGYTGASVSSGNDAFMTQVGTGRCQRLIPLSNIGPCRPQLTLQGSASLKA